MKKISALILLLLFLKACKDPFEPTVNTPLTGYLVVEGNINSGVGKTVIKLSRTSKLNKLTRAETAAEVYIVGEDLSSYPLSGNGEGVYTSSVLTLPKQRYRLRIKTEGKEYLSSLLDEKPTPPIDDITWQRDADGVKIYVHSHDDANNTKYYKWTFEETWEIHAEFEAFLKFKTVSRPGNRDVTYIVKTTPKEQELFYYCWKNEISNEIMLGSTAKLTKDIILFPVKFIKNSDERLAILYSINVKQIALDVNSYNFYKNLKDNTESRGSIFDRQPSEITGNIRCVNNPDEIVIGNVMLTSLQEKRIFIYSLWPSSFVCDPQKENMYHHPDTLVKYNGSHIALTPDEAAEKTPLHPDSAAKYSKFVPLRGFYAPPVPDAIAHFFPPKPYIIGYTLGSRSCFDCATRGSNIKPSFWPR